MKPAAVTLVLWLFLVREISPGGTIWAEGPYCVPERLPALFEKCDNYWIKAYPGHKRIWSGPKALAKTKHPLLYRVQEAACRFHISENEQTCCLMECKREYLHELCKKCFGTIRSQYQKQ